MIAGKHFTMDTPSLTVLMEWPGGEAEHSHQIFVRSRDVVIHNNAVVLCTVESSIVISSIVANNSSVDGSSILSVSDVAIFDNRDCRLVATATRRRVSSR